ncbi:MAG: hypothetical protein Q4B99_06265 [Clostridia bacterium]|nr:hypothetical protein [Clostridia bacterium]
MNPGTELLQYIHKTAEIGCEGILSVLDYAQDDGLRDALTAQLEEYRAFERDAEHLLLERGERSADVGSVAKASAHVMSAAKLIPERSSSRIAEMTIEGNNMGISKTLKHLHNYAGDEREIVDLATRLLAVQRENVRQLQAYL